MKNDGKLPKVKKAVENPGYKSWTAQMLAKHGSSGHARKDDEG